MVPEAGIDINSRKLLIATHNFWRANPAQEELPMPRPLYAILEPNTDYSISKIHFKQYDFDDLYLFWRYGGSDLRGPDHWIVIKISSADKQIKIYDPTNKLTGRLAVANWIRRSLCHIDTLEGYADITPVWIEDRYHDDVKESGFGCLTWSWLQSHGAKVTVKCEAGTNKVTWVAADDYPPSGSPVKSQDAWRKRWLERAGQVVDCGDSTRMFKNGVYSPELY